MPVIKNTVKGMIGLSAGAAAFFLAVFLWAFVSGGINGILSSVGVALPSNVVLLAGPLLGLAAAGYAMSEVFG